MNMASMIYIILKHTHLTCVILSGLGFLLRGGLMVYRPAALAHPVARVLPHLIDTLLLVSAIAMVSLIGAQVLTQPWLLSKIGLLLVYIGLGTVALKRGRTRAVRIGAFVAALIVFAQIVATGLSRNAAGLLGPVLQ